MNVEIVYRRTPENVSKIFRFLQSVDAFYRRPDDKIIKPEEENLSEMGHTLLSTNLGPLDVLAFIEQKKTYEDLLEHTLEVEFRGHIIHVLDIRTLIELKKTSENADDKQRLPILEETLRQLETE